MWRAICTRDFGASTRVLAASGQIPSFRQVHSPNLPFLVDKIVSCREALELKFVLAQHYASRQQRPGLAPSLSLSQLWWIADVYDWKDTLIHSAAIPPLTSWPSDGVVRKTKPLRFS